VNHLIICNKLVPWQAGNRCRESSEHFIGQNNENDRKIHQ